MTCISINIACNISAFPALATDDFIFIKTWPNGGIYQLALNDSTSSEPLLVVGGPDAGTESGIDYDNFSRSIVWSVGNIIKRRSIADGATEVVLDLCKWN